MVGGSTHQQPQASQFAPPPSPSSTAPAATTEEEEFLKRNTDCVYFLASPLTCKKGSECEYRHSDIARVNPRDCWYWLNGNCLNPKCAFRHPPLDGLLGAEVAPHVGPSLPLAPVTPAPYPMSKQGVACIFFQKGFCLKGNLCPFLHGPPNTVNNKAAPPVPSNQVTKPPKTDPAKPIQEQKFVQQETLQKPSEFLPPQKKQPPAPARNGGSSGGGMEKKVAPSHEESAWYRPANVVPPPVTRSNHGGYSDNEGIMNGKDVEEYSREPTPGFDVLVDNELGESEYYPNEEQYGRRSRDHDFDMGRPVDFDVDRDTYGEQRNYDHGEGYSWEDHRQERILGGGRKRYPRDESPDQFDKSDLRHRISKQRRGNVGGLRSVVSRENPRDSHDRRENYHHHHHSHNHRVEPSSLSSRLRGRIKIPGRSISPGNENGPRVEREIYTGRISDRVKGRAVDDYRGFHGRYDKDNDFTGPPKRWEKDEKRKYNQQSDENTSFEGPKPLSEILKRKRGGSVNNNEDKENNEKETKEIVDVKPEEFEKQKNDEVAKKVGLIDEDAILDEELEAYDHKDGDYDYEQIDGEEYNLEEGEEEYLEEEDDGGKKESEVYT